MSEPKPIRALSKSRLIAFRQCPKRLWLELYRPELRRDAPGTELVFQTGHQVGEIARQLYDPKGQGHLIDLPAEGYRAALERSAALLADRRPIFEAGFSAGGAMAFADVMLPVEVEGREAWRMVEVKSSTSVKEYQRDDVAIQAFVARESGLRLAGVALAHIDTAWTYQGGGDYRGLLVEAELGEEALARADEVRGWIAEAQRVAALPEAPPVATGPQCEKPFACGFGAHCRQAEPAVEFPLSWLPRLQSRTLKDYVRERGVIDMRELPEALLNERQRRVRRHSLSGERFFDREGARRALAAHAAPPACFLDFETAQFAVPRWPGTRPFQAIPFQFSLHRLDGLGRLTHHEFLDVSGADPSQAFALTLLEACAEPGAIFVYNAGFEGGRIAELARRFAPLSEALLALKRRLVDLQPIAEAHYYHPDQHGSWSIKKLLPTIAPALRYEALDGVRDGEMAMRAYLEASAAATPAQRRAELQAQLGAYCALDTLALMHLWEFLTGKTDNKKDS